MPSDIEKTACKRKVRYPNEAAAQQAIKKINPARKLKSPRRAYKCPVCFGWHLTSQPKR